MLSIIMPGIRKRGWMRMYKSIQKSYSGEFELIIISPYPLTKELKKKSNVRWIEDWGTPTRCMQLGLIAAQGDYVAFTWDDAEYLEGSLDACFEMLKGQDYRTVVSGKYMEGTTTNDNANLMAGDEYYKINYHIVAKCKYFADYFLLFNTGIASKQILMEIGGLDCRFEAIAMAFVDLAARLQFYGAKILLTKDVIIKCSWLNGATGDHVPMHNAMYNHDIQFYTVKYSVSSCVTNCRLDINNWEMASDRWERRFGKEFDLTVLVPGIRVHNWLKLYNSIPDSFSGKWEMVFIGPQEPPNCLTDKDNIQYIKDMGTPIKCQQRGLLAARGKWVTWAADDGTFLKTALDKGFELLKENDMNERVVITGKYVEGIQYDAHMLEEPYYILCNHNATAYCPKGYYMLNVGLVSRKLLYEVGGWDCRFEVCPMAYNDLAIRLQNYGVKFILQNELMFECGHMPNDTGDHGPVHYAQVDHDIPEMKKLYWSIIPKSRVFIKLNNWKQCADVWERRFKQ